MPRKLCEREGCTKGAVSGGTPHCIAHGGGRRCKEEDCTNSAFDRNGVLHSARRGQAMQEGGLPQVSF